MKGNNKKFARFIESEYYDDYLEPPKDGQIFFNDGDNHDNDSTKHAQNNNKNPKVSYSLVAQFLGQQQDQTSSNKIKQTNEDFVSSKNLSQIPLTDELIKNFSSVLGPETLKCYENLQQIKIVKDSQVFSAYRDIYSKFETVPVLFLSVVPKEAVYLWQINRKCPYEQDTKYMVLDSKGLSKPTRKHISILMLAKITAGKDEILLNAKFVEDNKLIVKFQLGPKTTQAVIRLYEIKDFIASVRVNPYKYDVSANNLYSSSFILKGCVIDDEECLEVSRYNHNLEGTGIETDKIINEPNGEEEQKITDIIMPAATESENPQETKIVKNILNYFRANSKTFSEVFSVSTNSFFLFDKSNALILGIQGNSFWLFNYGHEVGEIETITELDGSYYIISKRKRIFILKVDSFPNITFGDSDISFATESSSFSCSKPIENL